MSYRVSVSVVIPAYNAADWLKHTIGSVLNQSFHDFEVIIVDDGSTDSTYQVVGQYRDSRIRYVYQNNRGLAGARNTGLAYARGQYVAFLDADDLWAPTMLAETVAYLTAHETVAVVRTGWSLVDADGRMLPTTPRWSPWINSVFERLVTDNTFIIIAALFRRECLDRVGFFDESLATNEDWHLWLRVARAGFGFGFIPSALAMYRRHAHNMTLNHNDMRAGGLAVLDKIFSEGPSLAVSYSSHLRAMAYANLLSRCCIEALRNDCLEQALRDFAAAATFRSETVHDVSLYYQILCVSVPVGHMATEANIDLDRGRDYLERLLAGLDGADIRSLPPFEKVAAKAAAYLALGMVYYTYRSDMVAARRHFIRSIKWSPSSRMAWTWLVRAAVGGKKLGRMRAVRSLRMAFLRRPSPMDQQGH